MKASVANIKSRLPQPRLAYLYTILGMLTLFSGQQCASAQTPLDSSQPTGIRHMNVPDPDGKKVNKATIFIGDADEDITHAVGDSPSFTKDTYGENYLAAHDQPQAIKDAIMHLPKDWPVNLVGHGIGGATAATIAVELADTRRINILVTIDPSGEHPDFALVKNSVGRWVNVEATDE